MAVIAESSSTTMADKSMAEEDEDEDEESEWFTIADLIVGCGSAKQLTLNGAESTDTLSIF